MFGKRLRGFSVIGATVAVAVVGFAAAGFGFASAAGPANPATDPVSSAAKPAVPQSITVPPTYESMDYDHDMMVTDAEAKKAMPNLNIQAADKNHDGQIDRVEYLDLKQAVADGTWTNEVAKKEVVPTIKGYNDDPVQVVAHAPKGTLKDPYDPANTTVVAEGHQQFLNHGCNACHGGGGGGGMCPPLNNGVWIYGSSDDTLFRLVTLGSKKLQEAGYSRVHEEIPALMPQQGGTTITKAGQLWKIITWIKSMNHLPRES